MTQNWTLVPLFFFFFVAEEKQDAQTLKVTHELHATYLSAHALVMLSTDD